MCVYKPLRVLSVKGGCSISVLLLVVIGDLFWPPFQHRSEECADQWGNQGVKQRLDNGIMQQPSRLSSEIESAEATMESSAAALQILDRLQELPWARIDTSFAGTSFPWFSHNLIQVICYEAVCRGIYWQQSLALVQLLEETNRSLFECIGSICLMGLQVTREWLNWEGEAVVQHLARRFDALEAYVQGAG